MMLVELSSVPSAALPLSEFGDHLRMGSGFAEDGSQDAVLEAYLLAALAAIEARIGKALFQKTYGWQLTGWREAGVQGLPIAPVVSITSVKTTDLAGAQTTHDASGYYLQKDSQRPRLVATGSHLPFIASGGFVDVEFEAGFGPVWSDIPVDLRQAVFLLAAHYYENRRGEGDSAQLMPFGVMALIETHRTIRLLGGGA